MGSRLKIDHLYQYIASKMLQGDGKSYLNKESYYCVVFMDFSDKTPFTLQAV